jgi:hypothetical protein
MKKVKIVVLLATMLTGLLVGFAALAPVASAGTGTENDPFGPGDKVDFCHYDGSDTGGGSGKYNMPNASTTATGPAGHQEQHEFDVIPSYWFAQHVDDDPVFFPGRNWPTLNHLPTSPIDFSPLLGSPAGTFIATGCGEPVVTTSSPPPTCPEGTTTVTATSTAPPVTVTKTVTETVSAAAGLQQASSVVPVPEDCTKTVTETVTPTVTVTKTVTNTVSTTTPPAEAPSASLSTPVCTNQNIVATGVNPTGAPITFDVFVNGNLVDSFIVAANSQGTSASIPVKDNDVVTVKVQGKDTVLATKTVDLNCVTTTVVTTTSPPPVTTTPPPVTTTPPPVTTTPPPPVTTTPPPPVTTTPPPPVGGPGPGNPPGNPPNNPPPANPPSTLAFTGPEAALPIGALAVALATAGSGMMWLGRKRRDVTPPRPDLDS